jgi:hypothetical protein
MLAPIRGGNWNNGSNAGVFALNLNNSSANSNINVGFRDCMHTKALQGSHSELLKVHTGRHLSGALPEIVLRSPFSYWPSWPGASGL